MKISLKLSFIISFILMFMIMPLALSAQLQSASYYSPLRGIISSGGVLQSQNYSTSGTVLWYDPTSIFSTNYTQMGIGNVEILNTKSTTDAEDTPWETSQSTIFPNPLREESLLRFYTWRAGTASLELYDYTGSKIYSASILVTSIGYTTIALREFYQRAGIGVFLLKLNFGSEAKSMIILKI